MMMFLDDQIKFCFSVWRWFSGGINSRWWHPEHTNSSFSSGCSQLSQSIFSTWRNIYRSMCSDDRIGRLFWGCRIRNHRWRKDLHNVIPGHRDSSVSGVPVSILPITNTQPTVVRRYIVHTAHIYPPWIIWSRPNHTQVRYIQYGSCCTILIIQQQQQRNDQSYET